MHDFNRMMKRNHEVIKKKVKNVLLKKRVCHVQALGFNFSNYFCFGHISMFTTLSCLTGISDKCQTSGLLDICYIILLVHVLFL